jgi:hypothetical protein
MAVEMSMMLTWVVMPGGLAGKYQHFGETSVSIYVSKVKLSRYTPWRHMGREEV